MILMVVLLIASPSDESHLQHLQALLQCLVEFSIIVNPEKCVFA